MEGKRIANDAYFAFVEEQLLAGKQVVVPLLGVSMKPTLLPGDRLTLSPLEMPLQIGRVYLFRYGQTMLLHRLVKIEGNKYVMQGDNCATSEEVERDDVVAQVVAIQRRGGRVRAVGGAWWRRSEARAIRLRKLRPMLTKLLGREGRRKLRPWYFVVLALLMWAPLNGVGIPLNNYILGLRADHLLHASVYIPCALFLIDLRGCKWWQIWLLSVAIGFFTEGIQYLLPYRGFDVNDLVANAIGATLGLLCISLVKRRLR